MRTELRYMSCRIWIERVQGREEDHFYAMIGAISAERANSIGKVQPCEAFMRVCEKKGDFSFIYSAAKREDLPLRKWRPVPGDLPSILPWHGWGTRQPGRLCHDGLWLDDMIVVHQAPPQEEARRFVQQWLTAFWEDRPNSQQNLEENVYATLRVMGFTGSTRCVTTAEGYFFPFEPVSSEQVIYILVSTALKWNMGSPGLVSYKEGHEKILYTPGVYIGSFEGEDAVSVRVG
jgi:hypothetical protein